VTTLIDITRRISPAIAVWPGDAVFTLETIARIADGSSVNLTTWHMSAHTGTHADAEFHFADDGRPIDQMPLDRYLGRAQVITVERASGGIVPADLHDTLISAPRILFHTPASALPDDQWPTEFVTLTPELIDWLADRGVILIGLDSSSVDAFDSKTLPSHHRLRERGIANLEGLALADAPDGQYELIALPLRVAGACASPVRAMLRPLSG
jgi:arylformamidase